MLAQLLFALAILYQCTHSSDDSKCSADQKRINEIILNKSALDVFYFTNDTKKNIQLTWAVENSGIIILVTMTETESGPGLTSDIYRSNNNGKTFSKITELFGEKVYIRREHGLQRQQNQKELFLICYDIDNQNNSLIFVTKNGGISWEKTKVPFVMSGQLIFHPRPRLSYLILTLEEKSHRLFLSLDGGKSWTKAHDDVVDFFWSFYAADSEQTFYVLHNPGILKNDTSNQTLFKTTDYGRTWIPIMDRVIRVWAPKSIHTKIASDATQRNTTTATSQPNADSKDKTMDRFLYVAHLINTTNQTMHLSVSLDGGANFRPVYLPSIHTERFYSVLEVEGDMAFVHVDAPNDTGYGTLFTSDTTGQILTESLRYHLFPNHAPITDFYRVASMRGTYLTTRMNPNRTLYTVITHDRGASWRPLGVPLNVEGACPNDAPSVTNDKASTSMPNTPVDHVSNEPTESGKRDFSNNTISADEWNEWSSTDLPASKVCGLQISSQFSIRNRVIASAPLSISSAPGLILAHGHVATHLKNTPADVFVSTDGGYTWNKTLDGPHYCQITNRGGLLVAVPADTLWPDVLRFSTDEGRCWHTIPLRSGVYHPDFTNNMESVVTVKLHETTLPPSHDPLLQESESTTDAATTTTWSSSINDTHVEPLTPRPWDETVVFAGLVTEPGGRATAAAVYGYGTVSQHWRVAIVDFVSNGMVTRMCASEDYETWVPHSSVEGSSEGCLLGVKQRFRRLKKDSLCVNDYGMDPLVGTESCTCTPADFECEYGYSRNVDSLECNRNTHIPLFDPCLLPPDERKLSSFSGYRRIPGDQCVGGWQPPFWNQTIALQVHSCSDGIQPSDEMHPDPSNSMVVVALIVLAVAAIIVGVFCHQRNKHSFRSAVAPSVSTLHPLSGRLTHILSPWKWKGVAGSTVQLFSGNDESLWPPVAPAARWNFTQMDANGFTGETNVQSAGPRSKVVKAGSTVQSSAIPHNRDSLPHRSHMRPSFVERFRQTEPDVTGLIEAEELAFPFESPYLVNETECDDTCFHDPLASPLTAPSASNTA